MKRSFKYEAIIVHPNAIIEVNGFCDAEDEASVRQQLCANNLTVIDVREASHVDIRIERLKRLQQMTINPIDIKILKKRNWFLKLEVVFLIISIICFLICRR